MKKKGIFIALFVLVLSAFLFSTCASLGGGGRAPVEPRIASYIRTWPIPEAMRQDGSPYWNAGMINGEHLTHLIISFALIDPADGTTIYIPELRPLADGTPMFSNLWDEVAILKERYPHLKVNFSVGGYGARGFTEMSADPSMRATFVANIVQWLDEYNLDGVDVDWEYPVGPPWDDENHPADRRNYILLLQDIRDALDELGTRTGKRYGLSTAVPASGWFVEANDVRAAARIVDSLKMMSYDYYGGWSRTTGHQANLYNNPLDPAWGGWSTDQALNSYLWAGIPPEKIALGFGFYGRAWQGVEVGSYEYTPGLFQPWTSLPFYEGTLSWTEIRELLKPGSGYTRYWDDVGNAPYLYNGDIWISYTDEEQIKVLTDYAKEKGLGGVFNWEYGHDMDAELLKILSENAR